MCLQAKISDAWAVRPSAEEDRAMCDCEMLQRDFSLLTTVHSEATKQVVNSNSNIICMHCNLQLDRCHFVCSSNMLYTVQQHTSPSYAAVSHLPQLLQGTLHGEG